MDFIKKIFSFFLPWPLRRRYLNWVFGYEIDPSANIGWAWVFPKKLIMKEKSCIRHLTIAIHLDIINIGAYSSIGRSNWITGFPSNISSGHFAHQHNRKPELHIGKHSAITKNHHLDCTDMIQLGDFVTVAGYQSQLLTHSINLTDNRQDSRPIFIGDYSFVSTNVVILGGASLPAYSVLGAKSLLNKEYETPWMLYAGSPARPVKEISKDAKYFQRTIGYVI